MRLRPWSDVCLRGFGLFAGLFVATTTLLDRGPWFLDLRALPPATGAACAVAAATLAVWSLGVTDQRSIRRAATCSALLLAGLAVANAVTVMRLRAAGEVITAGLPLSAVIAAGFVAVALRSWRSAAVVARVPVLAASALFAAAFPVAHIATFGRSDYRRQADAIVVFGARAYADGRASLTLADRVRTGCALWHEGRAPVLFLSGGPGDGAVHETEAMRRVARAEGVPDAAIVLDPGGVSTRATVTGAAAWLRANDCGRVLAVSHAYHLPRVKLLFEQAGVPSFTVPARESRTVAKEPWFVLREVAAWWVAWAAPVRANA